MNRIEREKQTVQRMIELYCHHHLKVETMPKERNKADDYCEKAYAGDTKAMNNLGVWLQVVLV